MTASSWRFVTDDPGVDCWTAWSSRNATLLLIPVEEGRVYGYAAATTGGSVAPDPDWLSRTFAGFPPSVTRAVASAVAGGELHHGSVDELHLDRWHRGRLLVIGDAAHATGPVWAQGAAMAMEDALVLADLLASSVDWSHVGADFERLRRPRVEHVQRCTDKMSRIAAVPTWIRSLVSPVLGPRTYRETYGPLRSPVP